MLPVWSRAALTLTTLFAIATIALSREWETGQMDADWQLVFGSYSDAAGLAGTVMNLDGSNSHPLAFNGRTITNPNCSPNGSFLTFHIRRDTLFVMNAASGQELWHWNEQSLSSPWAGRMGVSDDGQTVIFWAVSLIKKILLTAFGL